MTELGGIEFGGVDEGVAQVSESLSEEALARLQANAAAIAAIRKEEKKTRKKDTAVANILLEFLQDKRYSHLFILIAKLIARDCPSIFILAIVSLVHKKAAQEVHDYIAKHFDEATRSTISATASAERKELLVNSDVLDWITSVQMVLSTSPDAIIRPLLLDEKNIDGSVLQLTAFILADYFKLQNKTVSYEQVQPIAMQLLHSVLAPYIAAIQKSVLAEKAESQVDEDDE